MVRAQIFPVTRSRARSPCSKFPLNKGPLENSSIIKKENKKTILKHQGKSTAEDGED